MKNNFFKIIYEKLIKADDTPHRVALGFAIGIFYGLFPFVGVIFTVVTAFVFRANKVSALIGCFVTNTWISAILIIPSIKIGAKIFGLDWRIVWQDMLKYLKMSDVNDIFKALSADVVLPSVVGFFIIAFVISLAGYFISLYFIIRHRNKKR